MDTSCYFVLHQWLQYCIWGYRYFCLQQVFHRHQSCMFLLLTGINRFILHHRMPPLLHSRRPHIQHIVLVQPSQSQLLLGKHNKVLSYFYGQSGILCFQSIALCSLRHWFYQWLCRDLTRRMTTCDPNQECTSILYCPWVHFLIYGGHRQIVSDVDDLKRVSDGLQRTLP